jgi:hypothetical protein
VVDTPPAGGRRPERQLDEGEAIRIIDHFILRYRLPDGSTVVDRFVAGRKDLTAGDREMLLGWRDPVEGIFEIQRKEGGAVVLLNLVDDLEYRTYSNVGRAASRGVSKGSFLHTLWGVETGFRDRGLWLRSRGKVR